MRIRGIKKGFYDSLSTAEKAKLIAMVNIVVGAIGAAYAIFF